ncbi:MAG: CcmD family protein [Firmicutes bacterium]|nr:CcmD family protein [Bacillota bacterium]
MELREAIPYVVAAYMGIWVVLFAYVFVASSKISGLKKELDALTKAIEKKS